MKHKLFRFKDAHFQGQKRRDKKCRDCCFAGIIICRAKNAGIRNCRDCSLKGLLFAGIKTQGLENAGIKMQGLQKKG